MKNTIYLLLILLIFSCNKVSSTVKENKINDDDLDIEISVVDSSYLTKILDNKEDIKSFFTKEEIKKYSERNISLEQIKEAKILAQKGDEEAINNLIYVYYTTRDYDKLKNVLELGEKYGIKEAIFNLALFEIKDNRYENALKYFEKLPKNYKKSEIKEFKIAIFMKNGIEYLNSNKYDMALKNFLDAYKLGAENLEYDIAKIYEYKNDDINRKIWLKKAVDKKNILAMKELVEIYTETGESKEAIEIYIWLYNNGEIDYARNIYLEYLKNLNNQEALKWYKTARKLDLVNSNPELEKLAHFYE